jgi:hypothetical protein
VMKTDLPRKKEVTLDIVGMVVHPASSMKEEAETPSHQLVTSNFRSCPIIMLAYRGSPDGD